MSQKGYSGCAQGYNSKITKGIEMKQHYDHRSRKARLHAQSINIGREEGGGRGGDIPYQYLSIQIPCMYIIQVNFLTEENMLESFCFPPL